jgi:signal transduction histidine kinase/ligand-binding sensor domain-containing protein
MRRHLVRWTIIACLTLFLPECSRSEVVPFTLTGKTAELVLLPQSAVTAIFQDSSGFIWFGTSDGIYRYDGEDLEKYHPAGGSRWDDKVDRVSGILEWRGRLWAGWESAGITYYDAGTDSFVCPVDTGNAIPATSVCADGNERLWIGSLQGVYSLSEKNGGWQLRLATGKPGGELRTDVVTAMCKGRDDAFYFGTFRGVLAWDRRLDSVRRLSATWDSNTPSSSDTVHALLADPTGSLFIGSQAGVERYDPATESRTSVCLLSNGVTALQQGRDVIWIGGHNPGRNLYLYSEREDAHDLTSRQEGGASRPRHAILSMLFDSFHTLWIGTNGGGVERVVFDDVRFAGALPDGRDTSNVAGKAVWSFHSPVWDSSNSLFIGTGNGICELDRASGRSTLRWKNRFAVRAILCEESNGEQTLWAGLLGGGLVKLVREGASLRLKDHFLRLPTLDRESNIYCLERGRSNSIWIGTNGGGLRELDAGRKRVVSHPLRVDGEELTWILTIHEDPRGILWCGTWRAGLICYDPAARRAWRPTAACAEREQLDHISVLTLCEDRYTPDVIWIGTNGDGLIRLNTAECRVERVGEQDGLSSNTVYGIVQDSSGLLWVTTTGGLTRYHPGKKLFRRFTTDDGLRNSSYNLGGLSLSSGGRIFLGGNNGFDFFDASETFNTVEPRLFLSSVRVFDRNVSVRPSNPEKEGLTFSHEDRYMSFRFRAIHTKSPMKNSYMFFLQGLDTAWRAPTSQDHIDFISLPPGEYQLKVRAANADGVLTREALLIPIIVRPPYWMTWWLWLLAATTVIAGLYLLQQLRIRRAVELERVKTVERERVRQKMAADLHDDLGARATRISLTANLLNTEKGEKEHQSQIRLLAADAERLVKEVRGLTWEIDPGRDTIVDLAIYLKSISDDLFEGSRTAFVLNIHEPEIERAKLPPEWRQHLSRVFKEALANVMKHAGEARRVTLDFWLKEGALTIELKDNGVGFDTREASDGQGLANMAERAHKLGGTLHVRSSAGSGTSIRFEGKLP